MSSGKPRNLGLASWPPSNHLLNFPQPPESQSQRLVSVHFQLLPDRVLNLRPSHLGVNPDNGQPLGQLQAGENDRMLTKKIMRRCYLVASVYSVIAVIQMLLITMVHKPVAIDLMRGFVLIILSLMALFFLTILDIVRKILWMSIILSALFAELLCLGVTLVLTQKTVLRVTLALLAACILIIVGYLLGACLPKFVLPGERAMLVLIIVFVVLSIFLITMNIFTDKLIYAKVYFCQLLVMLFSASLYHAQLVHGRRFALLDYEFVISATYTYLHFLLFFSGSFYCMWFLVPGAIFPTNIKIQLE